ncbi:pilus (MSHA type) biogenesis protein MshL [Magnetococcales bacterium HHB-1]
MTDSTVLSESELPENTGDFGEIDGEEGYTISVTDMAVRDLLFALARDANMNVDVYPGIQGRVTIQVVDQPLPKILDRIAKQVNLRYEIDGQTISITPDRAYLKVYQVDYVNLTRKSSSTNKVSTQLTTSSTDSDDTDTETDDDLNQSTSTLESSSENQFWESLSKNLETVLQISEEETTTGASAAVSSALPPSTSVAGTGTTTAATTATTNSSRIVALHPSAGIISIYATRSQHNRIQKLLDSIMENVHRQVTIESTVVEVSLSDRYQGGVDWNNFNFSFFGIKGGNNTAVGSAIAGNVVNPLSLIPLRATGSLPTFSLPFSASARNGHQSIEATVKALKQFGDTKVLSSPKIMAMNNQTAILKVVNNRVYFTVESTSSSSDTTTSTINTKLHTVPVGLVMTVTPHIAANDMVTLNVRPTISYISQWVTDPSPSLKEAGTTNLIPELQIKEMESLIRLHSGQIAVLGGLMQDRVNKSTAGLPVLSDLPAVGELFKYKDDSVTKTELVLFIRPVVMSHKKPRVVAGRNRYPGGYPASYKTPAPKAVPGSYQHLRVVPVQAMPVNGRAYPQGNHGQAYPQGGYGQAYPQGGSVQQPAGRQGPYLDFTHSPQPAYPQQPTPYRAPQQSSNHRLQNSPS